uniref:CCHC-type domain-containing protein n=1 Tax=Oryzias melastigma TaxID=30732 RepID=A0A3B3BDH1_ORYME
LKDENELARMDPKGTLEWRAQVEATLSKHEDHFSQVCEKMNELCKEVNALSGLVKSASSARVSTPVGSYQECPVAPPERFSGDPAQCRTFISQCDLYFTSQPSRFLSESAKVAFAILFLTGKAGRWGTAEWGRRSQVCSSFKHFSDALRQVFDPVTPEIEAGLNLPRLSQNNRSVDDYAIEFRTLAADCSWGERALTDVFYQGLNDFIKDELAARDCPTSFDALVELASRIDRRMRDRRREKGRRQFTIKPLFFKTDRTSAATTRGSEEEAGEPMQLGYLRLSPEERERRQKQNLCFYCGEAGHQVGTCPVKDKAQPSSSPAGAGFFFVKKKDYRLQRIK